MKALVLTCDAHAEIADLVFRTYERCWPNHPFTLHVPYQEFDRVRNLDRGGRQLAFTRVPSGTIRESMEGLLQGVEDDEWVWWCMVDKFLKAVDGPAMDRVGRWLPSPDSTVAGVMTGQINHIDDQLDISNVLAGPNDVPYYAKRRWHYCFYQPHFLRGRVLRGVFLQSGFRNDHTIWDLDRILQGFGSPPGGGGVYVSARNMLLLGESTHKGKMTPDCVACFRMFGLEPPDHMAVTKFNMPVLRHVTGTDAPKWRRKLDEWDRIARGDRS